MEVFKIISDIEIKELKKEFMETIIKIVNAKQENINIFKKIEGILKKIMKEKIGRKMLDEPENIVLLDYIPLEPIYGE